MSAIFLCVIALGVLLGLVELFNPGGALIFLLFFLLLFFHFRFQRTCQKWCLDVVFVFVLIFSWLEKTVFFMTNGILSSSVELLRNYFPVDLSYSSLLDIISGCEYWIRWLSCSRRVRPCKHDEYCKNNWKFQVCLLFQMVLSEENDCFLRNCFKVRYFI